MADAPKDISEIESYHAHIYYDPAHSKDRAAIVRDWVERGFAVQMGRWHDQPVGPHPSAMYQIAFGTDVFSTLVPWLMLNRQGLTVLIHPNTDRPKDDHLVHAIWLGEILPLNAGMLPEVRQPN
jgi:aromatic ring-cleaving dioxygenase